MTSALTTTDDLIDKFLAEQTAKPRTRARLIFAIDATGSRQPTWDTAVKVQAEMFHAAAQHGGLDVQLAYFRGYDEFKATRFFGSAAPLVGAMTGIMCRAGATQINRTLAHIYREHEKEPVAAAVLVGDCFEELSLEFSQPMPPIYAFHEGEDEIGRRAYAQIANMSRGALLPFDSNSPSQLRELLGAVAAYVTGGASAMLASTEVVEFRDRSAPERPPTSLATARAQPSRGGHRGTWSKVALPT